MTQDTSQSSPVASGCPVSPLGYEAPPQPLGPDSLTWQYFGDWRGMLQGPWAGSMQNMHPQLGAAVEDHSTFFRGALAAVAAVAVSDRRGGFRRRPRPDHRGRSPRLPHRDQRHRQSGPPLSRDEPRRLLLGALDVLRRHNPCGRTVLRRTHRGAEAPAVRRARRVVPDVRHEHASGAEELGRLPGLLGSHVQRGAGDQLRRARGAQPDRVAETAFRGMDSGPAVGVCSAS